MLSGLEMMLINQEAIYTSMCSLSGQESIMFPSLSSLSCSGVDCIMSGSYPHLVPWHNFRSGPGHQPRDLPAALTFLTQPNAGLVLEHKFTAKTGVILNH